MTPAGVAVLALLLASVLFAPRRWALLALVASVMYLTLGEVVDAFGLHLYAVRIVCLAAFFRVAIRKEFARASLNAVDKALLLAFGYRTLVYILNGNGSEVNAIGLLVDVVLTYFASRGLLSDTGDLTWLLRAMLLLLVPYVAVLLVEMATTQNLLSIVGGMNPAVFRNGRPRCVGSFAHASILGTFGASFLPLYIALIASRRGAIAGLLGAGLCVTIVIVSNSGGPLSCVGLGLVGWMLWPLRRHMTSVRIVLVAALIVAGFSMQAPIWYLPAKLSDFSGGDGWHRSFLMEVSYLHMSEWWVAGMSVLQTKDWFPYRVVTGGADIINYYLDFGLAAGIVAMGLLIRLLVRAFSAVGRTVAALDRRQDEDPPRKAMIWGLGCVLAMHAFNWFGLVYFDQFYVIFFLQLAALSSLSLGTSPASVAAARQAPPTASLDRRFDIDSEMSADAVR